MTIATHDRLGAAAIPPQPVPPARYSLVTALTVAVAAFGVALRAWPRGAMWLDEAQSVAFAKESFGSIPHALRQDGAPPLYYLLLRAWINAFGASNLAVRALSVLCSVLAMGAVTLAAHRLWGRRAACTAAVLVATNPFAVRYASEARMYSLVTLEVAIGVMLVHRWLTTAKTRYLTGVALTSAALLYTHYWALYLLGATLIAIATAAAVQRPRRQVAPLAGAVLAGVVLWLPWLPSFRFQSAHTATPWARPATFGAAISATGWRVNGGQLPRSALALGIAVLIAAAAYKVWRDRRLRRTRSLFLPLLIVVIACPTLAVLGGHISNSAYTVRYTAVVFPVAMLLAAAAVTTISSRRLVAALVAALAVISTVTAVRDIGVPRTRAPALAAALRADAEPGDFVVYCPDQLAPALNRLIAASPRLEGLHQVVFPGVSAPARVNWIDYRERYQSADPAAAAAAIDAAAGGSTVWLVWSGTYPPTQPACSALLEALQLRRPHHEQMIADDPSVVDHGALWRFDVSAGGGA